jgi:hypothetical protein
MEGQAGDQPQGNDLVPRHRTGTNRRPRGFSYSMERRPTVANDKAKKDWRDRVAASEDYDVDYLIRKTGISLAEPIGLIHQFGYDRKTLDKEAKRLKG